ncbi:MAG: hypothetical protein EOP60_09120 [Sphingomonadales bacterium]|nr:MAG: hypothetical protein EOP60_09120 [Sphingomonadales bacterium]
MIAQLGVRCSAQQSVQIGHVSTRPAIGVAHCDRQGAEIQSRFTARERLGENLVGNDMIPQSASSESNPLALKVSRRSDLRRRGWGQAVILATKPTPFGPQGASPNYIVAWPIEGVSLLLQRGSARLKAGKAR